VILTCVNCGGTFGRLKSQLGGGRGKFCSRRCLGQHSVLRKPRVSKAETVFGDALTSAGLIVLRQHRLGPWTVDFYAPATRLVIEFDGHYWHSLPAMKARDERKSAWLAEHGYRLCIVKEPKHYTTAHLEATAAVLASVYRPQEESGDATERRSAA